MGNFVDHVKITCKAGNGGNGSMSSTGKNSS